MDPKFERETQEAREFLRRMLDGDPAKFEKRADDALDRSIGKYVERKRRRRAWTISGANSLSGCADPYVVIAAGFS